MIADLGIDFCIIIHFTKRFSRLSPEQFIKQYLNDKIKPKEINVGDDFRFGQNRSGDLELFKKEGRRLGFRVNIIPSVSLAGEKISSTRIRELIATGHLQHAARLLGRLVSILGKVEKGDSRGKRLGFPTANIYPTQEILPPLGVYVVNVVLDKRHYAGMANVGLRPSFKKNNNRANIEVYILDFNKGIYGKEIVVEFIKKIREEKEFLSQDALVNQLKKDEKKARRLLI